MRFLRRLLLLLIVLAPLVTLWHRDDLGHWDTQRSAMAGPDEFSYLLMADHFLHAGVDGLLHGFSLKATLGRDTFYPPGYPLLVALWAWLLRGLTVFRAHVFNAGLLCADTLLVYLLARRMLGLLSAEPEHRRLSLSPMARPWIALLVAGVFATNWHVLECALLLMSEPAFMLVVFTWLWLALRRPDWPASIGWTLAIAALAVAAWSIRGAGIVCVATTLVYAATGVALNRGRRGTVSRLVILLIVIMLPLGYQAALAHVSPEKSLAAGDDSANSYSQQLLRGLTEGGDLSLRKPADYPGLAKNLGLLVLAHFNDYASSFVPWPRENPDLHPRDIAGKIIGGLGLLGWLWHLQRGKRSLRRDLGISPLFFLDVFLVAYMALYLIWPFRFARFWSPIVPFMLVFAADAIRSFTAPRRRIPSHAMATGLLALLLLLSVDEVALQLGNYARRLNYVSDGLRGAVHLIMNRSSDPAETVVAVQQDNDAFFAMAWYFAEAAQEEKARGGASAWSGFRIQVAAAHDAARGGRPEPDEALLARILSHLNNSSPAQVYFVDYYAPREAEETLARLRAGHAAPLQDFVARKVYQRENIVSLWEIQQRGAPTSRTLPP